MLIDYDKYKIYKYTINKYLLNMPKEVVLKYGNQLAFLFQNGFIFDDTLTIENIESQLELYNYFESYEDFQDLLGAWKKCFQAHNYEVGYRILDAELDEIIKATFHLWKSENDNYTQGTADLIDKYLNDFKVLVESRDLEVSYCVNDLFDVQTLKSYFEKYENGNKCLKLIFWQKIFTLIMEVHKKLNEKLSHSKANEMLKSGNINDELYGSAGYYDPIHKKIVVRGGSAVSELKKLISNSLDRIDILLLAKEVLLGEPDNKVLATFVKRSKNGDYSLLEQARLDLIESGVYGVLTLLELKHGLSLIENDKKNSDRALSILLELESICKFVNYDITKMQKMFE